MMKLPLDLISDVAICIEAVCMQDGDEKYGPYNYRVSKVQAHIYLAAAKRHIMAVESGEDFDPKTGKPHLGYARATLGIYIDAWVNGFLIDTRPLPSKAFHLLAMFERTSNQAELTPGEITEGLLRIIKLPQPSLENSNAVNQAPSVSGSVDTNPVRRAKRHVKGSRSSKLGQSRSVRRRAPR